MATVTEQAKEALLGVTEEPQLSQQTRAVFSKHAKTDQESGERYLGEEEFVNAIAPQEEDYVSFQFRLSLISLGHLADILYPTAA